jgi:hypothetical protein
MPIAASADREAMCLELRFCCSRLGSCSLVCSKSAWPLTTRPAATPVEFGLVVVATSILTFAAAIAEPGSARRRWLIGIATILTVAIVALLYVLLERYAEN